jgi:hypothetical protein
MVPRKPTGEDFSCKKGADPSAVESLSKINN